MLALFGIKIKQNKCPKCKSDEIYMTSIPKKRYVDKMLVGEVVKLLFFKNSDIAATIIFSESYNLLTEFAKALNDYDIKNVFCKGNVFHQKDYIKVIMFPSIDLVTRINLNKASTIVFLDPIYNNNILYEIKMCIIYDIDNKKQLYWTEFYIK
jgi:hypothetical protein